MLVFNDERSAMPQVQLIRELRKRKQLVSSRGNTCGRTVVVVRLSEENIGRGIMCQKRTWDYLLKSINILHELYELLYEYFKNGVAQTFQDYRR